MIRRRKARLKHRHIAVSIEWEKQALIQHARDKGINASGHWHKETIVRKIQEKENGIV